MSTTEEDFQRLIKRASQPLESKPGKDVPGRADDCSDKQTHSHTTEDTSD
jgi:hypothetical protein